MGAPAGELAWLAAHCTERTLEPGEIITRKGGPAPWLTVILSGSMALFIDRGQGLDKVAEFHGGDVTGVLPYSRLVTPPGDVIALERTELLSMPRELLPDLARECHEIATILVHLMLDRTRMFTSTELQNEKMISLGKLSAGLAHELNNPASAIERSASVLDDRLGELESATQAMGLARLTDAQLAAVDVIRLACVRRPDAEGLSPLEEADREQAVEEWLTSRGLDTGIASLLADTPVSLEAMATLAEAIPEDKAGLNAVLRWAAAGCSVRRLASQIQDSAMRISGLVAAVKGFTHMDQAMVAQAVDLRVSLVNTVAVLKAKARTKSVNVQVNLATNLPPVCGFAAEISQIWGNLIDNALDAVPVGGSVTVSAEQVAQRVLVRIVDDGPGIPPDLQSRIFEPFFTTKPMGQGTGLGLDIVMRLLRHNNGTIEVTSSSAQTGSSGTEFRVSLAIAEL